MSNYPDDFKGLPEERHPPLTERELHDIENAREAESFLRDLPTIVTNDILFQARKYGLVMTGDDIMCFRGHLQDAVADSFTEGYERINSLLHRR